MENTYLGTQYAQKCWTLYTMPGNYPGHYATLSLAMINFSIWKKILPIGKLLLLIEIHNSKSGYNEWFTQTFILYFP